MTDKTDIQNTGSPKYFAQKCPVCNGWGTVSFKRINCHACEGKGYVQIPIDTNTERTYEQHR